MTSNQREELNNISKDLPTFEAVLQEFCCGKTTDLWWKYYYPLCFRYTADFFSDEELAREAVLPLFEHWTEAASAHNKTAKLITFFGTVAKNFCLNYQRDNSYGPDIVYNSEEIVVDEEAEDEEAEGVNTVDFVDEYPFAGTNTDDPETILINREKDGEEILRISQIRLQLFPGDRDVYDLLLQRYNSDEIANILERSEKSVEHALSRIRTTTKNAV